MYYIDGNNSFIGLIMTCICAIIIIIVGSVFCLFIKRKYGLTPDYFLNLKNNILLRSSSSSNNKSNPKHTMSSQEQQQQSESSSTGTGSKKKEPPAATTNPGTSSSGLNDSSTGKN